MLSWPPTSFGPVTRPTQANTTTVEDMDHTAPTSEPSIRLRPKPDRRQSGAKQIMGQGGRRKTDRIADDVGTSADAAPNQSNQIPKSSNPKILKS